MAQIAIFGGGMRIDGPCRANATEGPDICS